MPSGAKTAVKIVCVHKDWSEQSTSTMAAGTLHACALPTLGRSGCPFSCGIYALEHCDDNCLLPTSCLFHLTEPSQSRCGSIPLS